MSKVFPIGYSTYQSDQHIESLMNDPRTLLIDCRITPWSEHKPQYRKAELVQRWGKQYRPAGHVLGNRKHPTNKMYPGKIEIEIMNPEVGIAGLVRYLSEGHDLILLCQCLDYGHCHLKEIVRLLQQAMSSVEIVLQEKPLSSKQNHILYTVIMLQDGRGRVVYACSPDYVVQQFGVFADPGNASQEFKNALPGNHEYVHREHTFLHLAEERARKRRADLEKLRSWNKEAV
jgi:hypothetical protein